MHSVHRMQTVATDRLAWSVSVGHICDPCINGRIDRDVVWVGNTGVFKIPYGTGNFWGCKAQDFAG